MADEEADDGLYDGPDGSPSAIHYGRYRLGRNRLLKKVVLLRGATAENRAELTTAVRKECQSVITLGELLESVRALRAQPNVEAFLSEIRGRHNPYCAQLYSTRKKFEMYRTYDGVPLNCLSDPPLRVSALMRGFPHITDDLFKHWIVHAGRYEYLVNAIDQYAPPWRLPVAMWARTTAVSSSEKYRFDHRDLPISYHRPQTVELWNLSRQDKSWATEEDVQAQEDNELDFHVPVGVLRQGSVCSDAMFIGYSDKYGNEKWSEEEGDDLLSVSEKFFTASAKGRDGEKMVISAVLYATVNRHSGFKCKYVWPNGVPEEERVRMRQVAGQFGRMVTVGFMEDVGVPSESGEHWMKHLVDDPDYCKRAKEGAGPDGTVFLVDNSGAFARSPKWQTRLFQAYGGDYASHKLRKFTVSRANMSVSALDHSNGLCAWIQGMRYALEVAYIERTGGAPFRDCLHMFEEIDVPMLQCLQAHQPEMMEAFHSQTAMHIDLSSVPGVWKYSSVKTVPLGTMVHEFPPHYKVRCQCRAHSGVTMELDPTPPLNPVSAESPVMMTDTDATGASVPITWDDFDILPLSLYTRQPLPASICTPAASPLIPAQRLPVSSPEIAVPRHSLPNQSSVLKQAIPPALQAVQFPLPIQVGQPLTPKFPSTPPMPVAAPVTPGSPPPLPTPGAPPGAPPPLKQQRVYKRLVVNNKK